MNLITTLRKACAFVDELLFPRNCAVCGAPLALDGETAAPLCPACAADFVPEPGERCAVCGKPLISEQGTCMRCRSRSFEFDAAYPAFRYYGAGRRVLTRYKFGGIRSLARPLGHAMAREGVSRWPNALYVPVPSRSESVRKRGWDPVWRLCVELRRNGLAVGQLLSRKNGVAQKTLDYERRLSNMNGKISIRKGARIPPDVALVDDVMTTGATLSECARVLKEGGAERVYALVAAAD